jgi:hypothetical protein
MGGVFSRGGIRVVSSGGWDFARDIGWVDGTHTLADFKENMTKIVSSVNGWIPDTKDWRFIRSDFVGGFYLLTYAQGDRLRRFIFNQQGREVFREEWQEVVVKAPQRGFWRRVSELFKR